MEIVFGIHWETQGLVSVYKMGLMNGGRHTLRTNKLEEIKYHQDNRNFEPYNDYQAIRISMA